VSYTYQQVPVYNNTSDAQSYQSAVLAGLGTLPIANNSEALDTNIYWLAWTWANGGPTTQLGAPGFGGQACYIPDGTSVQIPNTSGGLVTLTNEQVENAKLIAEALQSMNNATVQAHLESATIISLMTALQESSLYNLPNIHVPSSMNYPGIQFGQYSRHTPPDNYTSLGLFQQQNSWGSVAQRLNQEESTHLFFDRIIAKIPNWWNQQFGSDIYLVQKSKPQYAPLYQGQQPAATALYGYLQGITCASQPNVVNVSADSPNVKKLIDAASQWIGNTPYVWGGGNASGPTMGSSGLGALEQPPQYEGKPGFDCSGLTKYAYAQVGVSLRHFSGFDNGGQYSDVFGNSTFTTNIADLEPGMLVFFRGVGDNGSSANPGHVGIYIGNGKMINAPTTGQMVSIATVTQSTAGGFVGGGYPNGFNAN